MHNKQKIKQIIFTLFIFSILVTAPLWAWSSLFKLSHIKWVGNQKISTEQLDKNFSFLYGQNIFKIKLEKIKEKLLSDPRIRGVQIGRVLPNQLSVSLEEKRPIILVHARKLLGLSLDLELLPLDSLVEDLPLISGCDFSKIKYYKKNNHQQLNLAWDLYQTFLKKDLVLANQISEICVENDKNLVVYFMPEGLKVNLGVGDWDIKVKRLQEVLKREKNLSSVDLRYKNLAVLKFKETKAEKLAQI
ncbi:MAG: hypothetical protein A2145_06485 [candidate division Zixibacteria bacterium RBG_16_40_9]|nr:MAG: hypothetical protein A2145_06485 [candidate division Zixibacteria bacterium RBG_16_40_9]